jgi:Ni,Fe-hydrogenase I large subunit
VNNKQSSVEWLMDKLFDPSYMQKEQLEWFEQAKAMHKEEITHAYHHSWYFRDHPYETAEKYYNETFGGDK